MIFDKKIKAHTSDMVIDNSLYLVNCQAHGILPEDLQIAFTEVWALIVDFCLHFHRTIKSQTKLFPDQFYFPLNRYDFCKCLAIKIMK